MKQLTKTVLETALNEAMTEHLGYAKHEADGAGSGNVRYGTRSKTVLTDATGPVQIGVPRDRVGTFEPQIVRKRQRRLSGVDEVVLSLYAKGLTTGKISAHFADIYGASVSKETISRITAFRQNDLRYPEGTPNITSCWCRWCRPRLPRPRGG